MEERGEIVEKSKRFETDFSYNMVRRIRRKNDVLETISAAFVMVHQTGFLFFVFCFDFCRRHAV